MLTPLFIQLMNYFKLYSQFLSCTYYVLSANVKFFLACGLRIQNPKRQIP